VNRNKTLALTVAVIVVASVALVGLWYPTTVPDVRIGYLSQDLHQLALRVAYVKGWFSEAGINVELVQFQNGAYEMDGFLAGQIDMGYLGIAPALTKAISQNIAITVLAAVNLEGSALMVMKDEYDAGRIVNVSDLVGKTILQPGPSTVQNFLIRLALNNSGLSVSDVNLETARVQDMGISLTSDKPAFIAWEPFPSLAEYEGLAVPLLLSGDIWPRHPCCVVATANTFFDDHPDIVQKVVEIHMRAEQWIVDHPEEALQIAIDWLGIDPTPVETAFNRIIYDFNVNRTGVQMYLEFLIDQGLVSMDSASVGTFLDSFINTTFIESA